MSAATETRTAVLFARVSTTEQAESGLGLGAQVRKMENWCEANGYAVAHLEKEEGVSGKASLADRAGLARALAALKVHGADVLLCAKLDRVSRDPLVTMTVERVATGAGARLVSAAGEGTVDDSPSSVFMKRILAAAAELEANLISARTKAALQERKAQGKRLGRPPKGFTAEPIGHNVKGNRLVKNEQWDLVLSILTERRTGATFQALASRYGLSYTAIRTICVKWDNGPDAFLRFTRDIQNSPF